MPQIGAVGAAGREKLGDGDQTAFLDHSRRAYPVTLFIGLAAMLMVLTMAMAGPASLDGSASLGSTSATVQIYLANGCYWERQWAYFLVETTNKEFARSTAGGPVCYHTGDARDYSQIGMGEATRVVLDEAKAAKQMKALARDFFDSFTGSAGHRQRPDPGDMGSPYRSFIGLPGGVSSPLYPVFEAENTFNMDLKPGQGGDADALNVVWVYDSDTFPFYDGEVYHQAHCDFSMSSGMPYPSTYFTNVWEQCVSLSRPAHVLVVLCASLPALCLSRCIYPLTYPGADGSPHAPRRHKKTGGYYGNLWAPTGCPESHSGIQRPGHLCT
jgi:peptide methionine sulfoxide reductase MsrA